MSQQVHPKLGSLNNTLFFLSGSLWPDTAVICRVNKLKKADIPASNMIGILASIRVYSNPPGLAKGKALGGEL